MWTQLESTIWGMDEESLLVHSQMTFNTGLVHHRSLDRNLLLVERDTKIFKRACFCRFTSGVKYFKMSEDFS